MSKMSKIAEEEVEKFDHLFDLPSGLRKMVIDRMKRLDRIRFSQCSKTCRVESFASEYYLESISLLEYPNGRRVIEVSHGFTEDPSKKHIGYRIVFEEKYGKKTIRCQKSRGGKVFWINDLDDSAKLTSFALEKTRDLMNMHRCSVKRLIVRTWPDSHDVIDFGDDILTNLKELVVDGWYARQLISKTTNSLRALIAHRGGDVGDVADCPQIYNVSECLDMSRTGFTLSQLLRLNANDITVSAINLSVDDVFEFLQQWKRGMLRDSFQRCTWHFTHNDFTVEFLFAHLNAPITSITKIVQYETEKIALLWYTGGELKFECNLAS